MRWLPTLGGCALVLSCAFSLTAGAASARLPRDLALAAEAYDKAQVTGDRAALERLVATDYALFNSAGAHEGRRELILGYTAPGTSLEPYVVTDKVEKVFGDTAILGGLVTLRGTGEDGKPFTARLRFSDIWHKQSGRWRVTFTQVTQVTQVTRAPQK
jgi:ketosteroid isomerase-like protein